MHDIVQITVNTVGFIKDFGTIDGTKLATHVRVLSSETPGGSDAC